MNIESALEPLTDFLTQVALCAIVGTVLVWSVILLAKLVEKMHRACEAVGMWLRRR